MHRSKTFTIDIDEIRRKITDKTSVIAPVHLFGNACEIDEILEVAKEFNLKIVSDAAQAQGTEYKDKDIGSFDDVVCFSFYPTKNMTTGEGGMITTNDKYLYEKMKLIRSHGQEKKYFHSILGLNYRMTEVEAAIGIEQLNKLDSMIERRRMNAELLSKNLSRIDGIKAPFVKDYVTHSYHQYSILIYENINRENFMKSLKEKGIASVVHYPRGIHQQPIFQDMYGRTKIEHTEYTVEHILSLPVHHGVSDSEVEQIINAIRNSLALAI